MLRLEVVENLPTVGFRHRQDFRAHDASLNTYNNYILLLWELCFEGDSPQ